MIKYILFLILKYSETKLVKIRKISGHLVTQKNLQYDLLPQLCDSPLKPQSTTLMALFAFKRMLPTVRTGRDQGDVWRARHESTTHVSVFWSAILMRDRSTKYKKLRIENMGRYVSFVSFLTFTWAGISSYEELSLFSGCYRGNDYGLMAEVAVTSLLATYSTYI